MSTLNLFICNKFIDVIGPNQQQDEICERMNFFAEKERNVNTDRFTPAIESVKTATMLNHDYFHVDKNEKLYFAQASVHEILLNIYVLTQDRVKRRELFF